MLTVAITGASCSRDAPGFGKDTWLRSQGEVQRLPWLLPHCETSVKSTSLLSLVLQQETEPSIPGWSWGSPKMMHVRMLCKLECAVAMNGSSLRCIRTRTQMSQVPALCCPSPQASTYREWGLSPKEAAWVEDFSRFFTPARERGDKSLSLIPLSHWGLCSEMGWV